MAGPPATFSQTNVVYYDEEECLGFDVFTAELELIVGSSRGDRRPDGIQLLELLQKMQLSIERTDRAVLRASQKRAEGALVEVLCKGACAPVRQLISACLYKLYTLADLLPLYSRVSSLQTYIQEKDRTLTDAARCGLLELLAHLSLHLGRHLATYAPESMAIATKTAGKSSHAVAVRVAALRLAGAVVEGLSNGDRNAAAVQLDAWRAFEKHSKDKASDDTRAAAVGVLAALARSGGGAQLWTNGGCGFEEAAKAACLGLEDAARSVREASAAALGDLAASAQSEAAKAALEAEKRPAKKAVAEKLVAGAFRTCLVAPFVDAAAHGKRDVCTALALGWVSHAGLMQSRGQMDAEGLIELAVAAVGMLDSCHRAVVELWDKQAQLHGDSELGSCLAGGELPLPQACVIYVLRVAVVAALPEAGQRKLLDKLVGLAMSIAPPVIIAVLEGMGALLEVLGEVPEDSARSLESTIESHLLSSSTAVRHQAAAALAALALASPAAAAKLLGDCIERLETCAQQLAMLAARYGKGGAAAVVSGAASGTAPGATGTPRGAPDSQCKHCIDALHGSALGTASLMVAAAKLPLGVPTRLPSSAYWIAKRLIAQPHSQPAWAKAAEREAGYILLGSFCAAAHPDAVSERQDEVLELLALALGPTARDALGTEKGASKPGSEGELAVALWWRAAALQALQAYVLGVLCKGLADDLPGQVREIAALLAPLLDVVCSQPALQEPGRGLRTGPGAVVAAAAAMLQLRLLEVFFFLPGAPLFAACHGPLIKLCARQLQGLNGSHVSPEAAASVCSSSLKHMLSGQEAMLGPWLPGRDLLEDELRTFTGDKGGPQQHPWEAGLAFTAGALGSGTSQLLNGSSGTDSTAPNGGAAAASSTAAGTAVEQVAQQEAVRLTRRFMPFPQPYALAPALLEVQLWLLGKMLAVVSPANQLQLLEVMLSAVSTKSYPALKKDREQQRQRTANCVAVAVTSLAGLAPLARRGRGNSEGIDKIAEKVLQLASALIEDNANDAVLLRAGAEIISAACCIGSDALTIKQTRSMCEQLKGLVAEGQASASPPEFRAVVALALGSIHRAKGGITLQALVPSSVEVLMAVASRPVNNVHLWALHALWLVANAAGPAYYGHVKQTLQLCQELLVSSFGDNPLLKPAAGRLANALVAVLGPEFKLGSRAYQKCKSLVTDLSTLDAAHDAYRGVEATWAELEQVLFAQQLILFAPRAVPAAKHIPLLQATLSSKRPALRRAAALTLRHLAERDANAVLQERIEASLLSALDSETDGQIAVQLREALQVLLRAGAPTDPAYWLAALSDVALAAAPTARKEEHGHAGTSAPEADLGDEDHINDRAATPPPRPSPSPHPITPRDRTASTPTPAASSSRQAATTTPRLRTRLFAAELLLSLFAAVGSDPRHRTPPPQPHGDGDDADDAASSSGRKAAETAAVASTGNPASEQHARSYLVDSLEALVDLGFKLATGSIEALKPAGARLMARVVAYFGAVADPLDPDCRILDQYQAQFVSALRAALAPGAPPALSIAGGALATTFLESGLADGDAAVMQRLMGLLCAPLARWRQLSYTAYAESVGVRVKVALLQAHAQCALIGASSAASGSSAPGLARSASGRGSGLLRLGSGRGPNFGGPMCEGVVSKAQGPYKELLLLLWGALLQDHAVLRTQHPAVVAQYRSVLWGDSSPDILAAVQPCLAAAWPVVLEAAAALLPPPAGVAAAREAGRGREAQLESDWEAFVAALGSGSIDGAPGLDAQVYTKQLHERSWVLHSFLLEFVLMVVSEESQALAASEADAAQRLRAALRALQRLLRGPALEAGLVEGNLLVEVLQLLTATCQEVLCPLTWAAASAAGETQAQHSQQQAEMAALASSVADTLKEVAASMPDDLLAGAAAAPANGGSPSNANAEQAIASGSVPDALLAALLCTSSLAVPYQIQDKPTTSGRSTHQPRYIPLGSPSTSASSMDAVLVSVLVAAQKLLRRLPAGDLSATVQPLMQLGLRLLLTAPVGVQLTAAQRYMDGALATAHERILSSSSATSSSGISSSTSGTHGGAAEQLTACVLSVALSLAHAASAACQDLLCSSSSNSSNSSSSKGASSSSSNSSSSKGASSSSSSSKGASSSSSSSSSGAAAGGVEAVKRLSALLSCQLAAMACLADPAVHRQLPGSLVEDAEAAMVQCSAALLSALAPNTEQPNMPPTALPVLEALRPLLQDATAELPPGRKSALGSRLLAALGPAIAAGVHASVASAAAAGQQMPGSAVPAAAEALKVLVLAVNVATHKGETAQVAVLRVLVPLLVEVAAPPNSAPAAPVLRDMAVKLVTAMPASASGAAFRSVVAALPADSKQRLQSALREAASAAAAAQPVAGAMAAAASAGSSGAGASAAAQKKPAIELKMNFAIPGAQR